MENSWWRWVVVSSLAGLSAGCASVPPGGDAIARTPVQSLRILTLSSGDTFSTPHFMGFGSEWMFGGGGGGPQPVVGAKCTVRNDFGTWTVTTPGTVEVPIGGPLSVECALSGFEPAKKEFPGGEREVSVLLAPAVVPSLASRPEVPQATAPAVASRARRTSGVDAAPGTRTQSMRLSTLRLAPSPFASLGREAWGPAPASVPLPGATCTVGNDHGTWELTTPGIVEVPLGAPLTVECRLAGYQATKHEFRCISPRTAGMALGAYVALQLVTMSGPAAAVALPAVGAVVAAVAGVTALGAAVGGAAASTGPDPDLCWYLQPGSTTVITSLDVPLTPQ